MAGMSSLAGAKRSRGGDEDSGSRKGRRTTGGTSSRRNETVDDGDEDRLRRSEAEREGGRWG